MIKKPKHQIYFTDCREGLKKLSDDSIDLVVSGPPYFDHITYSEDRGNLSTQNYSEFLKEISEVWENIEPKLKDGGIIAIWLHDIYIKKIDFFELLPFHTDIIKTFPKNISLRHILVWDRYLKKSYPVLPPEAQFGTRFQYILILSKGKTAFEKKLKDLYWKPIWYFKTMPRFLGSKILYHIIFFFGKIFFLCKFFGPLFSLIKKLFLRDKYQFKNYQTTCPPEVAQMLIKNFSKCGDVVCDPFLGSGTTTKVADKLKRTCIGFEINKQVKEIVLKKVGLGKVDVTEK